MTDYSELVRMAREQVTDPRYVRFIAMADAIEALIAERDDLARRCNDYKRVAEAEAAALDEALAEVDDLIHDNGEFRKIAEAEDARADRAFREGVEAAAKVADSYDDWCKNWGEDRNLVAACAAAEELAAAIRALIPATGDTDE